MGYKCKSSLYYMNSSIYTMILSSVFFLLRIYIKSDVILFIAITMAITSCILFIVSWVFDGNDIHKKTEIKNNKDRIEFIGDHLILENEIDQIDEKVKKNDKDLIEIRDIIKTYKDEQIQKRKR